MERTIKSFEVAAGKLIYTCAVGKVFAGEIVDDIIEHNGIYLLFNSKDELITEIHLPVVGVKYEYRGGELSA